MAKKVWKEDRRNNFLLALFLEQGCRLYKESCTMKYKVKWIEDHMGITRNMIRRYEKKGVISKNENGKDREFDENDLIQLWNIRVMVSLGFSLDDVKEVLCGSNLREVSEKRLRALNEEYRDLQGKINFLNVVKITGEMSSCFKMSANNFEEIYNLGLIQYVSPFERAKDIWALMDMLQLLEKLCDTSDKKIMDELYEWFGIGNDREMFVQVFETYLLCDERFEEIFGKEKCCELSALIATYGK
jgi:DNA-binding transcriptional MerR regulator